MSHAKLTATTWIDGKFTIDGEPFPYEIHAIEYRLGQGKNSSPRLILELAFDHITIEHGKESA